MGACARPGVRRHRSDVRSAVLSRALRPPSLAPGDSDECRRPREHQRLRRVGAAPEPPGRGVCVSSQTGNRRLRVRDRPRVRQRRHRPRARALRRRRTRARARRPFHAGRDAHAQGMGA